MNIPLATILSNGPDRAIGVGPYAGRQCYYKTALYNTLVALKPRVCLEIGTHFGGTAAIFTKYFADHMPDGVLVTADIKKYCDYKHPQVVQAVVYPHSVDVISRHWVTPPELLNGYIMSYENSVGLNVAILADWLYKVGATAFDFAFLDGDHQRAAVLKDIDIAKLLTKPPHYMLLDDTKEGAHEVSVVYEKELKPVYNHYDFDDWPIFVGASLIWT